MDAKRYSESHYQCRKTEEIARSGSRNRTSLRRRNVESTDHPRSHDRSKSAISIESNGGHRHSEFHLGNVSAELQEREKWFHQVIAEKDMIIHDLQVQLEYLQTKYRQKKMELSALKNRGGNFKEASQHYSSSKPEREVQGRDEHNCTMYNYGNNENPRNFDADPTNASRANDKAMMRSSGRKAYHYQG